MALTDPLLLEPYPFECWVAYRSDGILGSGTQSDPWDGSSLARFDQVMRNLPPNTCVHLGPSPRDSNEEPIPFQTKGFFEGMSSEVGWQAKPGLRLVGAGMGLTVLQLVNTGVSHSLLRSWPRPRHRQPTESDRQPGGWIRAQ